MFDVLKVVQLLIERERKQREHRNVGFGRNSGALPNHSDDLVRRVRGELAQLLARGTRVAICGGTGKSAAFINRDGLDSQRFPTVVASDAAKEGRLFRTLNRTRNHAC